MNREGLRTITLSVHWSRRLTGTNEKSLHREGFFRICSELQLLSFLKLCGCRFGRDHRNVGLIVTFLFENHGTVNQSK